MTSPLAVPGPIPELRGHRSTLGDYTYRLYTTAQLDYDAIPRYDAGGPATVTHDGWGVSTANTTPGEFQLNVRRGDPLGEMERHPLDGTTWPTREDATRAAYQGGALALMVYERDAARYGLPTAATPKCAWCGASATHYRPMINPVDRWPLYACLTHAERDRKLAPGASTYHQLTPQEQPC